MIFQEGSIVRTPNIDINAVISSICEKKWEGGTDVCGACGKGMGEGFCN